MEHFIPPPARKDAKLKGLDPAVQAELYAVRSEGGQDEAMAWLDGQGVESSTGALSEWFSWYGLALRMVAADQRRDQIMAAKLLEHPEADLRAIADYGDAMFLLESITEKDSSAYTALRRVMEKGKDHELATKKFEEQVAAAKKEIEAATRGKNADGGLSPEAIQRIEEAAKLL